MDRLRKWIGSHPVTAIVFFGVISYFLLSSEYLFGRWLFWRNIQISNATGWAMEAPFDALLFLGLPLLTCWLTCQLGKACLPHRKVLWSIPWLAVFFNLFFFSADYGEKLLQPSYAMAGKPELCGQILGIFLLLCVPSLPVLLGWAIGVVIIRRQRRLGRWETITASNAAGGSLTASPPNG